MSERLLVAFDGSVAARAALLYAVETHPADAVLVLSVVPPRADEGTAPKLLQSSGLRPETITDEEQLGELLAETAVEVAAESGHSVDTRIECGEPADVIVEVASEEAVDHVVAGAPVPGDDSGPVVQRIVRDCPATVTLVRQAAAPGQ